MKPLFPNNIFLTGFMGVGKSRIGALLAKSMDWRFLDSDTLIEDTAGMSIPRLFEAVGEEKFRAIENKVIHQVVEQPNTVISLGGGSLVDSANRECVLRSGLLIYLRAEVPTLVERLSHTDRPLLRKYQGEALTARVRELLAERRSIYEMAHIQVNTEGKAPQAVADEILKEVRLWKK